MITKDQIEQLAKVGVRTVNIKEGDNLFVRSGIHNYQLAEAIAFHAYMKGARPFTNFTSDDLTERIYREVPAKYMEPTPAHYLAMVKAIDVYIVLEPPKNPAIQKKFPPDKIIANQKSSEPIRKVILENKRWLYMGYPTPEAAKEFNIPYEELEELIVGGMLIDYDELASNCLRLKELLTNADTVHISDDMGTDLTLHVKGRPIKLDDGLISDEDVANNDTGSNIPAGEVFIAPHETIGEGTLFCPLTRERRTGEFVRNLRLVFKDGQLVMDECTAEVGQKHFKEAIERGIAIDSERYKTVRTTNFGELGIGLNPRIKKAVGYILTDEKIGGSVHVAIGFNSGSYGGTSESTVHWDFVTVPRATVEVTYVDGNKRLILDKGRIL